ncbi:RHS repeat-associated core domain-containing protein [Burkholderia gladioli]|uniref:RHS repeat-associated core domain-containing protein n=1 Tax=Burkholderia gladioli TaxID=28095 RepID=UPI00202F4D71|nr:RHS repeat-associated core domain-containing protein [Burkholderia gladioli]URV23735.1 DUF6531 domain-containing protein [Burkholderia gladioli]
MSTPSTAAPQKVHETKVAIMPLVTIAKEDAGSALDRFDQWLKSVSDGYVTLARVEQLASYIPVVSNIISAVDVVLDIKRLIEAQHKDFFDYLNLGIDLIGIIPVPPVMGEFRMGARPLLKLARQELERSAVAVADGGAQMIADAVISVLVSHLSTKFAGEVEAFIQQVKAKLQQLLDDCANHAHQLLEGLAQIFEKAASGALFDTSGNERAAAQHLKQAGDGFAAHDAGKIAHSLWSYLEDGAKEFVKDTANVATKAANFISPSTNEKLRHLAATARGAIPMVTSKIKGLNSSDVGGLMWLLNALTIAVEKWRALKNHRGQVVGIKEAGTVKAELKKGEGELETLASQAAAKHPGANTCKTCGGGAAAGRSPSSIGFALGDELFAHEDFSLPGVLPIVWLRTYRSFLSAYDDGELGARWVTPYTTRLDIREAEQKLVYHDATGRSIDYPLLAAGASHDDFGEELTLTRLDDQWLALTRGHKLIEVYERHAEVFRLAFLRDRNGNQIVLVYDEAGRLARVANEQSSVLLTHDAKGRLANALHIDAEGENLGTLASYSYDEQGDLIAAVDRDGNRREYRYRHHLITRYTDRTGRGMNLEWDGIGPKARCVREYADDGSYETRLAWDPDIRLVHVTDGLGQVTRHYYDIDGYTYRVIQPDGLEEWFYRDQHHNLTQHIFPDGSVERFSYDARGNLLTLTHRNGSVTLMEYDDKDQLTTIVDPQGSRWLHAYDEAGNLVKQTDPLGHETKYSYDREGQLVAVTDARGGTRQLAYDDAGQLTRYTDCSGKSSQWRRDARGRVLESKDAAGVSKRFRYGANGQLTAIESVAGTERFDYDAEGRLLVHTDPMERTTRYSYDVAGRLAARRDALGETLSYSYDPLGRLAMLTDGNGASHRFRFDAGGRLLEETGFDGMNTRYVYEPTSGRLSASHIAQQLMQFEYNEAGRLTRRVAGDQEERFMYDANGRLVDAQNSHGGIQHFFDSAGNLVREHHEHRWQGGRRSYVWHHAYDENGTRIRTVRPDGHRIDWLVYGSGHVHGIQLDGQELIQFERDDLHREVQRRLANRVAQDMKYDPAGRLEASSAQRLGARAPFIERSYRYDPAGHLAQIDDNRKGASLYRYDPVGRLVEALAPAGKERFAFDPANNLLDTPDPEQERTGPTILRGRAPNLQADIPPVPGNLLSSYAGSHFSYDDRGNLVEMRSPEAQHRYDWDGFGRLASASVSEAGHHREATYFYDPFGRRIGKEVNGERTVYGWDGQALAFESGAVGGTHYLYEPYGFAPLAQFVTAAVEGIETLEWTAEHRYTPEDDPLLKYREPAGRAKVFYYHCDQIGTPKLMTDEVGEIVWEAEFKAWGEAVEVNARVSQATGGMVRNHLRFQGQQLDEETGLHYNRFRYYAPRIGRYISKDPIGLTGGANAYLYTVTPTGQVDPFGLSPTWCDKSQRWRESDNGQFRSRPTELMKTQPDTAFFWSGRTNGVGGMDPAAAIAKANGGTTLEMLLEQQKVKMPAWDANNPTVVNEWGQMSKAYAQGACGLVRGVIGKELRPGNVWEGYEKGTLMTNPNVKTIQTIDPSTKEVTTIFQR